MEDLDKTHLQHCIAKMPDDALRHIASEVYDIIAIHGDDDETVNWLKKEIRDVRRQRALNKVIATIESEVE